MTIRPALITLCVFLTLACSSPSPAAPPNPVVAGANAFGVDLYKTLSQRDGNLLFSPFNIVTAFSMAAAGARGQTATEMGKVLHQTWSADQAAALGRVSRDLEAEPEGTQLHLANAIWLDTGFDLDPAYRHTMTQEFAGEVQGVDFSRAPEAARVTINRWVEDRTAHRIKDLLSDAPDGPMVITSAVYLKADWQTQFAKYQTEENDFHAVGGAAVRAPLMHLRTNLRYLDGGGFQAVAIPYNTGRLSMVIFLPKRASGLTRFEQRLTANRLEGWLSALFARPPRDVALTLPRYRIEDGFPMKAMLQGMGMDQAFADTANFSGLSHAPLKIAEATHKAFLAVDEEGTEAAAATARQRVRVNGAHRLRTFSRKSVLQVASMRRVLTLPLAL